jgi:hypothetical protein
MAIRNRTEKLEDYDRPKQEIGIFIVYLREGESHEDGFALAASGWRGGRPSATAIAFLGRI